MGPAGLNLLQAGINIHTVSDTSKIAHKISQMKIVEMVVRKLLTLVDLPSENWHQRIRPDWTPCAQVKIFLLLSRILKIIKKTSNSKKLD